MRACVWVEQRNAARVCSLPPLCDRRPALPATNYLQECMAGLWMGGMLGGIIYGFSHVWSGMTTQVGLTVAVALPVSEPGKQKNQ